MEYYKIYLPGSPSNRKKDLSQTSVFIPLRLLSTKISLTFQDKIPPFLITNIFTLSRNRLSVSEINLCLLYPPSASPNPTVVPLQLPRRAFCLLRMRPSPPSFPWVPLHNLPGPLLGSLLPWKYPPTIHPPSHLQGMVTLGQTPSTAEVHAATRVRALRSFEPTESNELAFEKGDISRS
ncbi:hypothetical protein BJV77DRAFT_1015440 [Russula vinacea]|nr:hypothetical protein BJV77DRAFT_1015440 [Russula vinacea]